HRTPALGTVGNDAFGAHEVTNREFFEFQGTGRNLTTDRQAVADSQPAHPVTEAFRRLEGRTPDRGVVGELEEDVTALAGFGRAYNPSVESVGPAVACGFDRAISEVCIGALIRHEQSCSLDRLALDPIGDRLYCFRIVAPDTVQDRSRSVRHTDRGSLAAG